MGKKAKVGKKRKDKFYHLAKETGYRARSAFKLIQLNRKYGFLQESRVLIDLCAAPGGWLQVAANFMPMSSVILGVDLVSIKPIKNVTTFQADITTDHCRQILKKELKGWKTDVVLNDGAPNVGSAWVQDAFTQAQLALSALKLASEFLRKGGWFVTKIFRSKDYTALLWVFQQLFKKVHSTKPQASRNESAEIFVVCQGYLAPDKLDEKFLDPKFVFKEIQDNSKVKLDVLRPEKKVRHRDGYDESNPLMFQTLTAREFIETDNAIEALSTINKIKIEDEKIKNHPCTSEEIKLCCEDIKVLGRRELKTLFTWRKKIRKDLKLEENIEKSKENEETEEREKTEEEKQAELDELVNQVKEEEAKELKRKNKKARELKKKLKERLAGKLADASGDNSTQEQDLFELKTINNKQELNNLGEAEMDEEEELKFESDTDAESGGEDNESDNGEESDGEYVYGDDELYEKPAKQRKIDDENATAAGKKEKDQQKSKLKKKQRQQSNPLLHNIGEEVTNTEISKAKQWYQKDIFKYVEGNGDDLEDEEYDIEEMLRTHRKQGGKIIENTQLKATNSEDKCEDNDDDYEAPKEEEEEDNENESENESESDTDDEEYDVDDRAISQGKPTKQQEKKKARKRDGFEIAPLDNVELGPEALALGGAMVTSRKRKRDIIDESFNRYSFHDENLPSWFVEDESKHTLRHIPVTKEEVAFYKQRMMEINARPIKKVIEAKTKKKYKTMKKMEKARKRVQGILDATDVSSQEKQQQIKGVYKKAGLLKKQKPETTYVVAKRGLAGKKYKRPANVKGPYRVVDPRMKKDLKAMKSKEKTKGRRKTKKR